MPERAHAHVRAGPPAVSLGRREFVRDAPFARYDDAIGEQQQFVQVFADLMLISRDRLFLDRIATHIKAAEGDSQ